eukprot:8646648-Pyramimonas_sp.AAC.1
MWIPQSLTQYPCSPFLSELGGPFELRRQPVPIQVFVLPTLGQQGRPGGPYAPRYNQQWSRGGPGPNNYASFGGSGGGGFSSMLGQMTS